LCHFLYKKCVYVQRKAFFSLARAEAALAKNFLCGGGAREKGRFFSAKASHPKKCYNGKCSKTLKIAFLEA